MPVMTAKEAANLHWATRPDAPVRTRPLSKEQIAHNVRYINKFYTLAPMPERREESVAYVKFYAKLTSRTSEDVVILSVYVSRETGEYEHWTVEETTAWVKAFGEQSYIEATKQRVAANQAKKMGVN